SQKHRRHGMNVQVIARSDGTPLWFSRVTPGRTHDLTAARAHSRRPDLPHPADPRPRRPSYQGASATVRTPYYHHREQPEYYQRFNRDHARLRAPGERAFAQLKSWRLLRRARCSTRRISTIGQAVHTLSLFHPGVPRVKIKSIAAVQQRFRDRTAARVKEVP
ncbi:transposase family protein, partial [Streptomyces filamentosus]|uniref:transposase family protein n=1 Tax=Streptomyces filamentosus TaxID=67294 RepID=UPI003410B09F